MEGTPGVVHRAGVFIPWKRLTRVDRFDSEALRLKSIRSTSTGS